MPNNYDLFCVYDEIGNWGLKFGKWSGVLKQFDFVWKTMTEYKI